MLGLVVMLGLGLGAAGRLAAAWTGDAETVLVSSVAGGALILAGGVVYLAGVVATVVRWGRAAISSSSR